MNVFRKAWMESRSRLAWAGSMIFFLLLLHVTEGRWLVGSGANDAATAAKLRRIVDIGAGSGYEWWQAIYNMVAAPVAIFIGFLMAGSGLNTQTLYGVGQGVHPSMVFTLSLPVRRRTWVLTRAGLGLLQAALMTVAALALPPALNGVLGTKFSWMTALGAVPAMVAGMAVFYWFSVFLATFLDELWQGMVSLVVLGMLTGFGVAVKAGSLNYMKFMTGGGAVGYTVCLGLSLALAYGSVTVVERREF